MTFHKVCFIEEIGTEKTFKFTLEDKDILIAKSDDGKIHAFDAMCNHQEKSMEKGRWNSQKAEITCPFHKAVFAVAEGGAVKTPPAFCPLPVYQIDIRFENDKHVVYVEFPE